VQTLPNIIVTANYHLIEQIFANGDVLFEANCHECRPDLGHLWLVKAQIEAVVRQRTNLDMLPVIADANDACPADIQVRMMMNSEENNDLNKSEADDDNPIIEAPNYSVPYVSTKESDSSESSIKSSDHEDDSDTEEIEEETEYVKNALESMIFLELLYDTLSTVNHEEILSSIKTKFIDNDPNAFEYCRNYPYVEKYLIIKYNKCSFIDSSDIISDRDPILQRQSQWGSKFVENVAEEVYNDYPEIMIRDFICVMRGGSHNHTFAELLRLAFHVLEFEMIRTIT
jgi:hypothetical protein